VLVEEQPPLVARSASYARAVSDLKRARFARLVRNALDDLPAEFAERMRNVEIVVEDEPDDEQRPKNGGELLGLYEGVPLTGRASMEPYVPDRISIFRGPIERMSASPRRQAEIVRDTVIHEIAHHFGISDERLRELGRGDAQ
jgi:predicted Zn-dependent protease with MMP-like domain